MSFFSIDIFFKCICSNFAHENLNVLDFLGEEERLGVVIEILVCIKKILWILRFLGKLPDRLYIESWRSEKRLFCFALWGSCVPVPAQTEGQRLKLPCRAS